MEIERALRILSESNILVERKLRSEMTDDERLEARVRSRKRRIVKREKELGDPAPGENKWAVVCNIGPTSITPDFIRKTKADGFENGLKKLKAHQTTLVGLYPSRSAARDVAIKLLRQELTNETDDYEVQMRTYLPKVVHIHSSNRYEDKYNYFYLDDRDIYDELDSIKEAKIRELRDDAERRERRDLSPSRDPDSPTYRGGARMSDSEWNRWLATGRRN